MHFAQAHFEKGLVKKIYMIFLEHMNFVQCMRVIIASFRYLCVYSNVRAFDLYAYSTACVCVY